MVSGYSKNICNTKYQTYSTTSLRYENTIYDESNGIDFVLPELINLCINLIRFAKFDFQKVCMCYDLAREIVRSHDYLLKAISNDYYTSLEHSKALTSLQMMNIVVGFAAAAHKHHRIGYNL